MTPEMICCSIRVRQTIDAAHCTARSFSQWLHPCHAVAMPRQGSALFHGTALALLCGEDILLKHTLAVGHLASHRIWDIPRREFAGTLGEPAVRVIPASATCSAGAIGFVGLTTHTPSGRCPAGVSCADHPQFRMLSGFAPHALRFIVRARAVLRRPLAAISQLIPGNRDE